MICELAVVLGVLPDRLLALDDRELATLVDVLERRAARR